MKLTKAEEQIMKSLWKLNRASVQDILKEFEEEKPARTTVATVLGVLENKQFVEHKKEGHINIYIPTVTKEEYSKKQLTGFIKDYFNGSFSSMFSFFAKEGNLSIEEIDQILKDAEEMKQ